MKTKLIFLLSFSVAVLTANAQLNMPTTTTTTPIVPANTAQTVQSGVSTGNSVAAKPAGGAGMLISQLTQHINSSSLTDDFNRGKGSFANQAQSSTDVKSQSGLLQKLEGALKSTAFTSGWATVKAKWLSGVKTATTAKQLAGYIKTLSENINTSSLSPTWQKVKPTFTAELDKLTK